MPQNYSEALRRYQEAADKGLPLAMYNLGEFYEKGWGVQKSALNSLRWYKKAAEAGNEQAMERLGAIYENGDLGEKADPQAAQQWYDKAQAARNNK